MKKLSSKIAVQIKDITKVYTIRHEKPTLVERIIRGKTEVFTALNNINLTIRKGERVGIIGPNGSGKTTLLKIIANITNPTSGSILRNGRVVSLIDLEAGFHPDLTGLQNIYLNGMLLGMTKKIIDKKLSSIISFADIGRFIDVPMFTYSFGMKLRVGFSVAIHSNPEILILDEGLVVGDEKFRKKSLTILTRLIQKKRTVILATHSEEFLQHFCKRVISLNHGAIISESYRD